MLIKAALLHHELKILINKNSKNDSIVMTIHNRMLQSPEPKTTNH